MKAINYIIILLNIVSAQFISDYNNRTIPNNIHGQLNYDNLPIFSPDRFNFNQGFSMSMMSNGSQSTSIASYSNNITYWVSNNLKINGNILIFSPTHNRFNSTNNYENLELGYNAGIEYKPTKNSYIQLNFQKLPNLSLINGLYSRQNMNKNFNNYIY